MQLYGPSDGCFALILSEVRAIRGLAAKAWPDLTSNRKSSCSVEMSVGRHAWEHGDQLRGYFHHLGKGDVGFNQVSS